MKAILLALIGGLVLTTVVSWLFRHRPQDRRARMLMLTFLAILPLLALVHMSTPSDLGFLPAKARIPIAIVDLGFTLFLFSAGSLGGILQLYNLADRGFSLRILIDIDEWPSAAMTLDEVMKGYSAAKGIEWMYDKRISGMVDAGLVISQAGALTLSERGWRMGKLFFCLQRFARVSNGKAAP